MAASLQKQNSHGRVHRGWRWLHCV